MSDYVYKQKTCRYCGGKKSAYLNGDSDSGYYVTCLSCYRSTIKIMFCAESAVEQWNSGGVKIIGVKQ